MKSCPFISANFPAWVANRSAFNLSNVASSCSRAILPTSILLYRYRQKQAYPLGYQFCQLPHMVCQGRFHRGRNAQRLVNPAEVVVGEVQTVCRPEVLPLLAESVRQPRQAAHLHSDGEILTLHMGRANLVGIGVAHDWDPLRVRHVGMAVPTLAFGVAGINLDELREVAAV